MGSASNPLVGSGWGSPTPGLFGNTPFQGAPPPSFGGQPPINWGNPGNLANPNSNIKDITRNTGLQNLIQGQMRQAAIPQFMQNMFGFGNNAGNVFSNFANLGSPFYKQKQAEGFTQGVKSGQDAQGLARQQLAASGYGGTPSGATAAMIGGMNQAQGASLAEQYLQNLFQNENLMMQGAQGEAGVANMFNPSQLFGNVSTPGSTQGPSAADSFAQIMGALGIGGKAGPISFGGK